MTLSLNFCVFFKGGITLGHCGQSWRCSQHRSWQDCTGVIIKSRKCIERKMKRIECTKFVLYQPCKGHSSHARQQRQKASGLVLLGKDAPDHLFALYQSIIEMMTRSLYQWILSFWYVFTWYLEMIVKSAALSSNQAVGVKKSLRFEFQVLQTLNRALYEDFFF